IIADKLSTSGKGVTGSVVIRHNLQSTQANSFRIGYVPQNDTLFLDFTAKETFLFASKMINGHLTKEQHSEAVAAVLTKLDLTEQENTPIKKLSGGQVKRASIGVELMGFPQVLVLDEPTSGLDSDTSER